jgi:O-antigen/teichoic acid export membrane protein
MGSLNRLLKNTSVLLASNIITKVLSALFIVVLARYLEDFGFGQYNFALSFAAVFIIFSDLGLDALTIKNVARDRSLGGGYLETVGMLRIGLSLILVAASLALGWAMKIDEYLLQVILVAGLAYMFDKVSGLFYALFRANERMELEAAVQVMWKIAQVTLGLGAVYLGFPLLGIMMVLLVSSVLKTIAGYSLVLRLGISPYRRKGFTQMKTLRESSPFAAYEIGNTIYMNLSIIILFMLTTPEDTGWFSAALRIILFMLLVPSAFDAAIFPLFSKLYSSSMGDMNFAYGKSIKFSLVAAIPVAVAIAIMSDEFASLFGSGFENTGECLFILAALLPLYTLNMLMKSALWSTDAQNRVAVNIWISLGVLACISYILIERDAYAGAAAALVIGESSFFALNLYWVRRKKLPMGRHLWKPVLAGLAMIGTAFSLDYLAEGRFMPVHLATLSVLVYALVVLALGFISKSDKAIFREALSRHRP